ncbi:MAG: GNAT family N-acetyltransferase [Oscillospiraceae bacterium]|nr:GNAT family N-acetyltransferase [Oscillospiraceae bacterium]
MIRNATQEDISKIKLLWDEGFSDPLSYVDFIYDKVAKISDTLLIEENGDICSMLTIIPTSFRFREKTIKTAYIYGAATKRSHRQHGYMVKLLEYAEHVCRENGYALCALVPGERYLYDFYANRGYSADFDCRMVRLAAGMLEHAERCDVQPVYDKPDYAKIFSLREQALFDIPHIMWDEKQLEFVIGDCTAYGESVAQYAGAFGESYAIFGEDKAKRMFIKECNGTSEKAEMLLLKRIVLERNPRAVTVQLPVRKNLFRYEGETQHYGMAKALYAGSTINDMDPYMNLMLD